jgi:hypothetical protein
MNILFSEYTILSSSLKFSNDPTKVWVIKITDFRQTLKVETGYGETNAWVEWIKYSMCALNKRDCYASAGG